MNVDETRPAVVQQFLAAYIYHPCEDYHYNDDLGPRFKEK
jgi:hypothetical protein